MSNVYIVVLSFPQSKEGWKILEVFNSMKKAGKYIKEKYPYHIYDQLSDNWICIPKNKRQHKSYIDVYERELL